MTSFVAGTIFTVIILWYLNEVRKNYYYYYYLAGGEGEKEGLFCMLFLFFPELQKATYQRSKQQACSRARN